MTTALIIALILITAFSLFTISSAIRRRLRHNAAIRRRLAEIKAEGSSFQTWLKPDEKLSDYGPVGADAVDRYREFARSLHSHPDNRTIPLLGPDATLSGGDEGDPLPAAMLAPPNLGGEGNPEYRGPNYADEVQIVDEMKITVQWSEPDGEEFAERRAQAWRKRHGYPAWADAPGWTGDREA